MNAANSEKTVGGFEEEKGFDSGSFKKINTSGLNDLNEVMGISRFLLQKEASRLEEKFGTDHPRVKKIKKGLEIHDVLKKDIDVELEVAEIKVPKKREGAMLLHGRVTDLKQYGIAGITVFVEDEKSNVLRAFGHAKTDASGYYSLQISSEVLRELGEEKVYPTMKAIDEKIIHRENSPLILKPDSEKLLNVAINPNTTATPNKAKGASKKSVGKSDDENKEKKRE